MGTLRGAVARDQVHHAYLFVGSRGTGKTSMAKILAACLNCEQGPTVTPCGVCESCTAIARASSLDVIEMDAASNNSVDDIRELRDSVAFAPVSGRRKVYILDEAHMLSTAAWNAFLKTLEEPPPDTVFVLATTEAQKVPATVVDRCHRFDFQRPSVEQVAEVLRRAARAESIDIPPEAIAAIARAATGSFRDALGTLEQLLAYSGPAIGLDDVLAVLGIADAGLLERAIDAVAAGDARGALLALAECADAGRDANAFAGHLESRARELMLAQVLGEVPPELALTPETDARLLDQAQRVPHATVVRLLELIGSARESIRAGADARTSLELAIVQAARPETDASIRALLARIERLEGGHTPPPPLRREDPYAPRSPAAAPEPRDPSPRDPSPQDPCSRGQSLQDLSPRDPAPRDPSPQAPGPGGEDPRGEDPRGEDSLEEESPDTLADAVEPVVEPPEDLQAILELWPAVIELVGAGHALCGAVIADTRPVALAGEDLTVGFPASAAFLKKKAEDQANRQIVTDALRQLAGGRWRITYELCEGLDGLGDGDGAPRAYTEEEWIERFKTELDAEEISLVEDSSSSSSSTTPNSATNATPAINPIAATAVGEPALGGEWGA